MKTIVQFIFTVFIVLLFASTSWAVTRVISPSGSGTTCSAASPCSWSTAYNASSSGDVIQFRGNAGAYVSTFTFGKSLTYQSYPGEIATIDGEYTQGGAWGGLVTIEANNVTIDGLEIKRSYRYVHTEEEDESADDGQQGFGIRSQERDNLTIKNCKIHHTGLGGIILIQSDNFLVENNEIYETNYHRLEGSHDFTWTGALHVASCNTGTIKGNLIYDGGGEGILVGDYWGLGVSTGITVEKNTLYDIGRPNIHVCGVRNSTFRHNLIYCTMANRYAQWPGGPGGETESCGPGISIAQDMIAQGLPTDRLENNDIYGNMVASCSNGLIMTVWWDCNGGCPEAHPKYNRIFNNTFVESNHATLSYNLLHIDSFAGVETNQFKNNVFFESNDTIAYVPSGLTFSYNLWSKAPDTDARSSTDPGYNTYPSLNIADYLTKTTGWTSLSAGQLSQADFALRATATSAIDTGTNLGIPYNADYYGTLQSVPWDLGALVYGTGAPPPPPSEWLAKTAWTIEACDSQETVAEDGRCVNAIDGNNNSFWHTQWDNCPTCPDHPHTLDVDLGQAYTVDAVSYLQRQSGGNNGRFYQYEIYTSPDNSTYTKRAEGTWSYSAAEEKVVVFASPVASVRYVRFKSLTGEGIWGSAAEVGVREYAEEPENGAPNGTIDVPTGTSSTIYVGQALSFSGTGTDPDGDGITYLWTFGTGSGISNSTSEDPGTKTFNVPGTFVVTLTVTDEHSLADATPETHTVYVSQASTATNVALTSTVTVSSETTATGQLGIKTKDDIVDGYPGDYTKEWASNNEGVGAWIQFTFPDAVSIDKVVLYDRPHLVENVLGGTLTFSSGDSVSVGNLNNDGTATEVTFPTKLTTFVRFTITSVSTTTVSIGLSEVRIWTSSVTNQPPNCDIDTPNSFNSITVGQSLNFTATCSDSDNNTPLTYLWTFGSGSGISNSTVEDPGSKTFNNIGSFTVTLTGTDSLGLSDATPSSMTVNVSQVGNQPPNGIIDLPATGFIQINVGDSLIFNGTGSDSDNNTPLTYLWTFDSSGISNSTSEDPGSKTFSVVGTFTIIFTVKDSLGLADQTPASITVSVIDISSPSAPEILNLSPSGTVYVNPILTAITNENSTCKTDTSDKEYSDTYGSNIATTATTTASSEEMESTGPGKAIDGSYLGCPANCSNEWSTSEWAEGGPTAQWIRLTWGAAKTLGKVKLCDRPNLTEQVTSGTLSFSDSSTPVSVGVLTDNGTCVDVVFAPRSVTWVQFDIDSVKTTEPQTNFTGLSEFEAFEGTSGLAYTMEGTDTSHTFDTNQTIDTTVTYYVKCKDSDDLISNTASVVITRLAGETPIKPILYFAGPSGVLPGGVANLVVYSDVNTNCKCGYIGEAETCNDIPYTSLTYTMNGSLTTEHNYSLAYAMIGEKSLTQKEMCYKCSDVNGNISDAISALFYYPPSEIYVDASSSGNGLTSSTPIGTNTLNLSNVNNNIKINLVGNVTLDISTNVNPIINSIYIGGTGYTSLTGNPNITFYNSNWETTNISTMGNNVKWGSRILPLMNWSGSGGIVANDTLFLGNGTNMSLNLSGLSLQEGQSCYVKPKSPHNLFSFSSKNLGPCTETCNDPRLCVDPTWQKRFMFFLSQ